MKSVTIKDRNGILLIKILQKKNGEYEYLRSNDLIGVVVDVRNDNNEKVWFKESRGKG